jgi:selenocysteine lyase/cysteine desulfurase
MDLDALRANTPGVAHRLHLNNAGASLMSRTTVETMTAHLRLESEIGGYEAATAAQDQISQTYESLATLLNARTDEIALFDNSTHAWNAAFYSIPFRPGDQILTGRDEYGSNVLAYLQIAARFGVEIVVVPNDDSGALDPKALQSLITDRTRLIGMTWVPTSGGLVNPAAEVGRIAQDAGILFLLDATQAVGQFPVDVEHLHCDLLTGTGRKFLRGPRGTGFLYVRSSSLDRLDPFVVEVRSAEWDGARGFTWFPGAQRFETWENSYVNIVGLGAAVEQALDVGLDAIGRRSAALGRRLRDQLQLLPGVSTYDLGRDPCAIVTALVDGLSPADVAARLAEQHINVSFTVPGHTQFDEEDRHLPSLLRLSPHYFNTEAEIDRAVDVVDTIARAARPS